MAFPPNPSRFRATQSIPFYAGVTVAITLLGWGIGGIIGGTLADYLGRKRTMIYAILAYSVMTGFTALGMGRGNRLWCLRFAVGPGTGVRMGHGNRDDGGNVAG